MNEEGRTTGHVLDREIGRLRAGIVNAIEAFEDGDHEYALEVLRALNEAPAKRIGSPSCPHTLAWPGAEDDHVRFAQWEMDGAWCASVAA